MAAASRVWMSSTGLDTSSLWAHLGTGLPLYGLGLAMTVAPLTPAIMDSASPTRNGVGNEQCDRSGGRPAGRRHRAGGSAQRTGTTSDAFG